MLESAAVHLFELEQMRVLVLRADLGLSKELCGSVREGLYERAVTDFTHQEILIAAGRLLGVDGEGILALFGKTGIEAEVVPVTCGNSLLLLFYTDGEALLDAVVDAGRVADEQ